MSKIYPYAGFWKRVIAFLIDSIVISIPVVVGSFSLMYWKMSKLLPMMGTETDPSQDPEILSAFLGIWAGMFVLQGLGLIIFWLYNACMESSSWQATLGKKCMGIKVVDQHGNRISFARATGRTFSKWISSAIIYIGFLMAGATARKQALHDLICSTFVVDANFLPEQPLEEVPTHYALLTVSIIGIFGALLIPFIITFLGMMTAINSTENYKHTPAIDTLMELKIDSEKNTPFVQDGFRFSFHEDGIRATPTDNQSFALFMPKNDFWPCCEPLAGENACDELTQEDFTLKKCKTTLQ
jgi:uncharacterized RDD family membrane protein YckC